MHSSLKRLVSIEPPPADPVAPGSVEEWLSVETEIGLRLPEDYKAYIATYGAGQWADFFGIMNPFYKWKHPESQGYMEWMRTRLEGLEESRKEFPKYMAPFNPYPAPGGLIPFGYDDNGGTLCWLTSGAPDSWSIICLDGKLSECFDQFDMPVTDFLVALLNMQILPRTFPSDFLPIPRPAFQQYTTE